MRAALEKRLLKLEGPITKPLLMDALEKYGYDKLVGLLSAMSSHMNGEPVSFAEFMIFDIAGDVFALEDFRGKVPDDVIREAYSSCRNWGMPPAAKHRLRLLAGVIDEQGKVMPGYRGVDGNDCIIVANDGSLNG